MSAMVALGTPDECIVQSLATVDMFAGAALAEVLGIAIEDSDLEEADCALGQQLHAIETVHELVPPVFGEGVVTLHPDLVLLGVGGYALGDGEQTLAGLAVDAVERKRLIHRLLLALNLHRYAFLVELVLGDAGVHAHQHELVVLEEPVEVHLVLEGQFALLLEDLQEHADYGYLLQLIRLVQVVLQNLLRLPAGAVEQDVVQAADVELTLQQNFEDAVEVLADEEHLGVEESVDYGDLA